MLPTPCWPGLDRFGDWLCSALLLGPRGPAVERLGILEVKKPVCQGSWHFVEVPGVVAARSVVLRGTRLVKVSPSCCILLVLGSLVLYSGISALDLLIHSLTSPLPTNTLYQPSRPFTYRTSASVPQPSAYEFYAPQLSAKRRKPPQSAAGLRTRRRKDWGGNYTSRLP